MSLRLQPVRVGNGHDEQGMLVFSGDRLVVILVQLSAAHGGAAGDWFKEAGFGCFEGPDYPTFPDLDAAQRWIEERLSSASPPRAS